MSEGKLGYSFAPAPRWIFAYVRERTISVDDGWLLATLFHLARSEALATGGETPIELDTLLAYVHRKQFRRVAELERARDALGKRLTRAQQRGLFSYRVKGSPAAGYTYLFRLPTEPPVVSPLRPRSRDVSSPTSRASESGSTPDVPPVDAPDVSVVARAPDLHPRPCSDLSCPCSEAAADVGGERDRGSAGDGLCPSCRDVRDNTQPLTERNVEGPASLVAHAREDDDLTARLLAAADEILEREPPAPWHQLAADAQLNGEHDRQAARAKTWAAIESCDPGAEHEVLEALFTELDAIEVTT